jgi:hypothetical protein
MARSPITHRPLRHSSLAVVVAILVVVLLLSLGLLVSAAWKAQIGALGVLALGVISLVAVLAALMTTEVIPWHDLSLHHLRQPRVLGALALIMLGAFNTIYTLVPLLATKGGTDAALGELGVMLSGIRAETRHTTKTVDEIKIAVGVGQSTLVEQRLSGVWGEANGCAQTYRFTLDPQRLTVMSLASLPGITPFRAEYTRKSAANSVSRDGPRVSTLYTEEEINSLFGNGLGIAVDFVLTSNGATDHLLWDRKGQQQNKLWLVRCPSMPQPEAARAIR